MDILYISNCIGRARTVQGRCAMKSPFNIFHIKHMAGCVQSIPCLVIKLLPPSLKFCLWATIANVMFPRCQHCIHTHTHTTQADNSSGSLSMGQHWISPPNYEALVGKTWPAAPGVSRLQGINNEPNLFCTCTGKPTNWCIMGNVISISMVWKVR